MATPPKYTSPEHKKKKSERRKTQVEKKWKRKRERRGNIRPSIIQTAKTNLHNTITIQHTRLLTKMCCCKRKCNDVCRWSTGLTGTRTTKILLMLLSHAGCCCWWRTTWSLQHAYIRGLEEKEEKNTLLWCQMAPTKRQGYFRKQNCPEKMAHMECGREKSREQSEVTLGFPSFIPRHRFIGLENEANGIYFPVLVPFKVFGRNGMRAFLNGVNNIMGLGIESQREEKWKWTWSLYLFNFTYFHAAGKSVTGKNVKFMRTAVGHQRKMGKERWWWWRSWEKKNVLIY